MMWFVKEIDAAVQDCTSLFGVFHRKFSSPCRKKVNFAHTQMYLNIKEEKTNRVRTLSIDVRDFGFCTVRQSLNKILILNKLKPDVHKWMSGTTVVNRWSDIQFEASFGLQRP